MTNKKVKVGNGTAKGYNTSIYLQGNRVIIEIAFSNNMGNEQVAKEMEHLQ